MITQGYKNNFNQLKRAFENEDVCLMECTNKKTGKTINVICAVQYVEGDKIEMVPFAKMFDGNPYDEVEPPNQLK